MKEKNKEPLFHIVKRDALPWYKSLGIRFLAILLALILGPMCEQNFVRFMDLNGGNFGAIIHYPIAIGFFVVAVAVVIISLLNQRKINKAEASNAAAGME